LGLVEQTLRNWMKAAKNGKLNAPSGKAVGGDNHLVRFSANRCVRCWATR